MVSCYYIINIICFICHFILFLWTNLLIQCLVPVPVFCMFFVSQKNYTKRSPITMKIYEEFFWKIWSTRSFGGKPEGRAWPHKPRPRAPGGAAPARLVGPLRLRLPYFKSYIFPKIQKPSERDPKQFYRRRKSLFFRDLIWRPFPVICRRGNPSRRPSSSTLLPP